MKRSAEGKATGSIAKRLRQLVNTALLPMSAFALLLLTVTVLVSARYAGVTHNIATASGFNQNFKAEVDLMTYSYVAGSREDLPYGPVEDARALAESLQDSTGSKDSRRAISGVVNLCDNLERCLREIEQTEGYAERMHILETDVYIITQLIENYVYNYLYYEAGQMAVMQSRATRLMEATIACAVVLMVVIVLRSRRSAERIGRSITQPVDELYARVRAIGKGDLTPREPIETNEEKLQVLADGVEKMVRRINAQMETNEQRQIQLREMELALIQAQINPHFLYNTLDTIVWLIETGKNAQAQEMVGSLSNYFRSFLSKGRDIITVKEEILHVHSYLEIQQVRYKDILQYEIETDPRFDNVAIPKMTLQPLVENAIYHGIKLKRGGGRITVRVCADGEKTLLQVRDTGAGMTEEQRQKLLAGLRGEENTGFGLNASYRRLELKYGKDFEFDIQSAPGEGTEISIRIPAGEEAAE